MSSRNPTWAEQILPFGLPNFWKVTDGLYRGAQPLLPGYYSLSKLGIQKVVDFQEVTDEADAVAAADMMYERIPCEPFWPETEDVVRFLKIVTDPDQAPVFAHCTYGADRTGTMIAAFRVVVQGWDKNAAIDEFINGGYGAHLIWEPVIISFLKMLDVDEIKAAIKEQAND